VVAMRAAGVNYPDALKIQGKHQNAVEFPHTPGHEVAGVVTRVGAGVDPSWLGQAVYGLRQRACFAEEVLLDLDRVARMPAGLSFEQAAVLCTAYQTSYYAIVTLAALRAGETVLVMGAGGGVGLAAVQIAKALGARVIAAASSEAKLAACREAGADVLIDYSSGDFRASIKTAAGPAGVDVVYDPIGAQFAETAVRSLAWRGRYLVVGFAAGEIPRIPLNLVLLKNASILGVFMGEAWSREPELLRGVVAGIDEMAAAGKVRPHVSATYPLAQAGTALQALLQRQAVGKIVLVP